MANSTEIKIEGLKELENKLLAMGQDMAAKSIVASAYAANKKMEDSMKNTLTSDGSVDTGLLRTSIARKKLIYASEGSVVIITGVNRNTRGVDSKGKLRIPSKYAHLVQERTKFIDRAVADANVEVVDAFIKSLQRKIKKYTK